MALGLIGKKVGMTRVFTEEGVSVPVTVVHAPENRIMKLRTPESDGYYAVQLSYGSEKASRLNKPTAGQFVKSGVAAGQGLREFRLETTIPETLNVGTKLSTDLFVAGQKVSVAGVTKGKGFAGPVKRHHFHMQGASHGNSISHRAHGATGQCQDPGRVFKGKKMAGHMGNVRVTTKNLEVVQVDAEKELLLIKGAVPGAPGGEVVVKPMLASEINLSAHEQTPEDQPKQSASTAEENAGS